MPRARCVALLLSSAMVVGGEATLHAQDLARSGSVPTHADLPGLVRTSPDLSGPLRPSPDPSGPISDPYSRNRIGLELGVGFLVEAWNLNGRRESMLDATASMSWAFAEGVALVAEFHHLRVFQATGNAFVQGLSPLVRWRMFEHGTWRLFGEAGPGISWSDVTVPPRGTRFNYLFQGGVGVERRLSTTTRLITGFRFLHLSNNGREGRGRNPDFETFGAHCAVGVSF